MGSKAHAVVIPYPAPGHINPMMELAIRLASKGMLVTFVNILPNHIRIVANYNKQANVNAIAADSSTHQVQQEQEEDGDWLLDIFSGPGLPPNLRLAGLPDGLPVSFDRAKNQKESHDAVMGMGPALQELLRRLQGRNEGATCLVADSFLPWTESVAHLDHDDEDYSPIPWVFVWTQPSLVFSAYYYTFLGKRNGAIANANGRNNGLEEEEEGEEGELSPSDVILAIEAICDVDGVAPLTISDLPTFVQEHGSNNKLFSYVREQFHKVPKADYILGSSFYKLESTIQDSMASTLPSPIYNVGPLTPAIWMEGGGGGGGGASCLYSNLRVSLWEEEMQCLEWLDNQALESVLFVSFGSLALFEREQTQEIAYGLENSGQAFLWVIRGMGESCEDLPIGFIERVFNRGLLISWAPQLQVLAHPSIGGFLTHCGWNSTIESVTLGLPMLGLPYFSDQPTNCKLISDYWKIGLSLHKEVKEESERNGSSGLRTVPGVARREEVELKVRKLMQAKEGREMRRKAQYLSKEAKAAVSPNGTSDKALEAFVLEMEKRAFCPHN